MLKKERHDFVLRHINLHNRLLTNDLVQMLNVSEDTIRRDLHELSAHNLLRKVHGGAVAKVKRKQIKNHVVDPKEIKTNIAKKAVPLIKDGMVVLVGGGETVIELTKLLPRTLIATFITVNPLAAVELTKFEHLEVILIGGPYSKDSQVTYGGQVVSQVSEIIADLSLLEADGLNIKNGLTHSCWEICQLYKAMMAAARKSVIICHSKKLDTSLKARVAALKDINYLITDLERNDEKLEVYRSKGLSIR
jgi:DeoR/GlpR family transcriptional regulator of sugar metabolism